MKNHIDTLIFHTANCAGASQLALIAEVKSPTRISLRAFLRKNCFGMEVSMNKTDKLVAYFSASGTTRRAANTLAGLTGADIYEIKPQIPYTSDDLNWNNKQSRSSVEMSNPASRPELADKSADISKYNNIYIGFPVWWYVAPTIINTFLESYDFTGKTVIPFATSGGSGIGNCEKNLHEQYPDIRWSSGKLLNSNRDFNGISM